MGRHRPAFYFLSCIGLLGYILVGYVIERNETFFLLPVYAVLFVSYVWILRQVKTEEIFYWLFTSFLFRTVFIVALPSLSDDFYRFIWDGRLWSAGYHPFAELPSHYVQQGIASVDQKLYLKLNSPEYFTIYPTVSQFVFWLSVKISPQSILGSVVIMRLILLLAEFGSIVLIQKLLNRFSLPATNVLLYALNPLVIIELTGNLHFEALVIFFVLLSLHLILKSRGWLSASSLALAIGSKLLPLVFIPALVRTLGIKQSLKYGSLLVFVLLICFLPLFSYSVLQSMSQSITLYFNKFEFNASIYYLVREYGFWRYGYNIIQTVGWKLGLIATVLILLLSFWRGLKWDSATEPTAIKALLADWLWVLSIYFMFATVVHPWYITTLLVVSIFTSYRYPVIWTGLIFLTYAGYTQNSYIENLWLIGFEYLVLIGYLIIELKSRKPLFLL